MAAAIFNRFSRRSALVMAGLITLTLLSLSGCAPSGYAPSYHDGDDIDDVEYLSSYGDWVYLPPYDTVWLPDVVMGWQPFYYGHWIWTIDGWAWVSYEPYGWLVYHYGFWGFRPDIGWFWVPGDIWYPATVEWYTFGDYAAWAPLPPPGIAWVDPWDPYDIDIWVVVDIDDFTSENIGRYRVERPIYQDRIDRRIVSERAPERSEIEGAMRRTLPAVELGEQPNYMRRRDVREPEAADERNEKELKRMVLPKVEKRRVEKHAPRVEKEVLKPRKEERKTERESSGDDRDAAEKRRK